MNESEKNDFLIDGFPRNEDNLQGWTKVMGEKVNLQCVLFFHCTQDICTTRCLSRGAAGSGRFVEIRNLKFRLEVFNSRSDDNEESLKKRFVTYEQATMPIIKLFEEKDLVKTLDASKYEMKLLNMGIMITFLFLSGHLWKCMLKLKQLSSRSSETKESNST